MLEKSIPVLLKSLKILSHLFMKTVSGTPATDMQAGTPTTYM
jgi:hypothetical protein